VENLYDHIALLSFEQAQATKSNFEQDDATKSVAGMLRKVSRAFATDDHGLTFMMWRDEQRAVAELMRASDTAAECIGYATFVKRYDYTFKPWFSSFEEDLHPTTARDSERFSVLQYRLAELAKQLDPSGTYQKQWKELLEAKPAHHHHS
jgi:hypothetical protein